MKFFPLHFWIKHGKDGSTMVQKVYEWFVMWIVHGMKTYRDKRLSGILLCEL